MIQRAVIHSTVVIVATLTVNGVPVVYSHDEMRSAALLGWGWAGGCFHQVNGCFDLQYSCFGEVGFYKDLHTKRSQVKGSHLYI